MPVGKAGNQSSERERGGNVGRRGRESERESARERKSARELARRQLVQSDLFCYFGLKMDKH